MTAKWEKQGLNEAARGAAWNDYVPKHLLPRLHAFELMMAPYAIAHMKIGLKLAETGYRFGSEERARIYLTNALEPKVTQLPFIEFTALAHEAAAVNEIKWHKRFTVVIGNPPYSVISANFNPFIDGLMDDYKKHVRGEQGLVALADDYLKFVRLSQKLLAAPNCGIWGMITNHGYLKGVIHRGARKELLRQFNTIFILDLHGDSNIGERVPTGKANENVFDIQQGVAVSIGVRPLGKPFVSAVRHGDLWGCRSEKYDDLTSHPISARKWTDLRPVEPRHFLIPFDDANLTEYEDFPALTELMAVNSCGVKTHRDGVVIDYDKATLVARMSDIASERRLELLRERYGITDTPNWKLKDAQSKIKANEVPQFIQRLTYRPFDYRWIYYNPAIIEKGDSKYPTLRHMLHSNVALLGARIQATGVFDAVFASKFLVEMKTAESSRSCTAFPLFLTGDSGSRQAELTGDGFRPNLNPKLLFSWAAKLGLKTKGDFGLPACLTPEDIFHYVYAVFYSPTYRSRYAEFLKIDFPRLPLTSSLELFRALAELGGELVALHLLESSRLDQPLTEFIGSNKQVSKVGYSDGTVWIDASGTRGNVTAGSSGFRGVPEAVWNFHIGGYQVCEKWLKDRKSRKLSADDIRHYHRIVVALSETIRLMADIDRVIDQHGGWPRAFVSTSAESNAELATLEVVANDATAAPPNMLDDESASQTGGLFADEPDAAAASLPGKPEVEDSMATIRELLVRGPLSRDELIREVATQYGYHRLGKNIAPLLDNHVRTAVRRGIAEVSDGGVQLVAKSIEDYDRTFLKDQFLAALAAVSQGFVYRDEAIRSFSRWMGYRRLGPVIRETSRSLINGLIREDRLEVSGDEIRRSRA